MAKRKRKSTGEGSYRQEVFNVLLAQLLEERGLISAPESVLSSHEGRRMPDVLVDFSGLLTAIEGEVSDQPRAAQKALQSAANRVEQGIAQIGLAVIYPFELRQAGFSSLKSQLGKSTLQVAVVTEGGYSGFADTTVDGLAEILRRAFDQLVKENTVAEAVATLEAGIEKFAVAVSASPAIVSRMAGALGIRELAEDEPADSSVKDKEQL